MQATYLRKGNRIPYSNSGSAISAGDVVPLASGSTGMCGVAVTDIAATTGTGEIEIEGEFTVDKATGEAFTVGQIVYWDDSNNNATGTSSTTFYRLGRVTEAAASAATTAKVKLIPG